MPGDSDSVSARGSDHLLKSFVADAPPSTKRAGAVLACCLKFSPQDLTDALEDLWQDTSAEAVSTLRRWPFVDAYGQSWQMDQDVAPLLRETFRAQEPEHFRSLHNALATRFRKGSKRQPAELRWTSNVQVAFYSAGVDEAASARGFERAFWENPNPVNNRRNRLWVAALFERQAPLLSEHQREFAFFSAFRRYNLAEPSEDRGESRFEEVLATPKNDRAQAISEHLLGVLIKSRDPDRAIRLYKSSVELSENLNIPENEVRARQSLAMALTNVDPARAANTAALNYKRAQETGDRALIDWTALADAALRWQSRKLPGHFVDAFERQAIDAQLKSTLESCLKRGDRESALQTLNSLALQHSDMDDTDAAIAFLEQAAEIVRKSRDIPSVVSNLSKTTQAVHRGAKSREQLDRLSVLENAFDDS